MSTKSNKYSELIGCSSPEEVLLCVRRWTSDLEDNEHLGRSAVLEIHAGILELLRRILYEKLAELIWVDDSEENGKEKAEELKRSLGTAVQQLSFDQLRKLLKPCLDSFDQEQLAPIAKINTLRNRAAHSRLNDANYDGRNPFKNAEALAKVFVDSFIVRDQLAHLIQDRITDARAERRDYVEFYEKHGGDFVTEEDGGS